MRIIDRDVDFYRTEVEENQRCLRCCAPSFVAYYGARIAAAQWVVGALMAYRATIDTPHPVDTELEP